MGNRYGQRFFNTKVDPERWKCYDYYTIIKKPMWFQEVERKLMPEQTDTYTSPFEVREAEGSWGGFGKQLGGSGREDGRTNAYETVWRAL